MHSSSLLFPSPTSPFRFAPTTILLFIGIFSTVSFRSRRNVCFSLRMHPTCGAYTLITFNITLSSYIFKHIILTVTLRISTTLSTCSFFNVIPTQFFCFRFHSTKFYILRLCIFLHTQWIISGLKDVYFTIAVSIEYFKHTISILSPA